MDLPLHRLLTREGVDPEQLTAELQSFEMKVTREAADTFFAAIEFAHSPAPSLDSRAEFV